MHSPDKTKRINNTNDRQRNKRIHDQNYNITKDKMSFTDFLRSLVCLPVPSRKSKSREASGQTRSANVSAGEIDAGELARARDRARQRDEKERARQARKQERQMRRDARIVSLSGM